MVRANEIHSVDDSPIYFYIVSAAKQNEKTYFCRYTKLSLNLKLRTLQKRAVNS